MIKRVATAVVLIPLVLVLVLKAPLYVLALVAGAVAVLAIAEFLKLVTPYGVQPLTLATYVFVALFFVFIIFASSNRWQFSPIKRIRSLTVWRFSPVSRQVARTLMPSTSMPIAVVASRMVIRISPSGLARSS